ncbi:MAG: hypothetical protein OYH77_05215 [Pseudomonadota bacterium]|nr:hypothetical protein [Pseudomonadota bacterium]
MFCEENLKMLEKSGISYVVDAKLKAMSKSMKKEILAIHTQQKNGEDSYHQKEVLYRGRRLIISYNPVMAAKDRKDRQRLLDRLGKITDDDGKVTARKLIKNRGSTKYLHFDAETKIASVDGGKVTPYCA